MKYQLKRTITAMVAVAALLIPAVASGADFRSGNDLMARQPNLRVRVNFCHRYYLKRGGDTEGKISYTMRINKNGKVAAMKITERTVGEDGLVDCVSRAVRHTTYIVTKETSLTLPFVFATVNNSYPDLAAAW